MDLKGKPQSCLSTLILILMFCRIRICLMGLRSRDGENDCLTGLQRIDWIREYTPSNVIKCRHRTYTEAERKFLDYIDRKLEETYFSFFKLNSIDYGDQKHKFVFPIMSHDPLRVALWDEVQNLTVPDSPPPPEILPENHRALELQKEREYRCIPQLEFDTPYGLKYSAATTKEDLENAKTRKRNFVKSPDAFKEWYTTLIGWTEKLRESSKAHGWTVIDEELLDETWKAPKKLRTTETVASLRGENNELTKKVAKLEKTIAKLQQEQAQAHVQKKRKFKTMEELADNPEIARQVDQWRVQFTATNNNLKDEIEALKIKLSSEVKNHAKTTTLLGNEKLLKNGVEVNMKHQKELYDAKVKNLEDRIAEFKSDKAAYMGKLLGEPQPSISVRTHQNNRHESRVYTPTDTGRDDSRNRATGSAHSPSH